MKITTLEMEILLMEHFDIRSNLIVPCVSDWSSLSIFEVDLLVLSKSKYATAIEIKVSKHDLKNDINKKHIKDLGKLVYNVKNMIENYYGNFKHFYYAVQGFLKEEELNQIPSFAGLLVAKEYCSNTFIELVRKPKVISNKKWSDEMSYQLARLGTMKLLNYKIKEREHQTNCSENPNDSIK